MFQGERDHPHNDSHKDTARREKPPLAKREAMVEEVRSVPKAKETPVRTEVILRRLGRERKQSLGSSGTRVASGNLARDESRW